MIALRVTPVFLLALAIAGLVSSLAISPAWSQTDARGIIDPIYVDDDWDGSPFGTPVVFTFPDSTTANATIGTDAFARPDDGLAAASAGGTVYVADGSYVIGGTGVDRALHLDLDGLSLIGVYGAAATEIDVDGANNGVWLGALDQTGPHPNNLLVEGLSIVGWAERGIAQVHGDGSVVIQDNDVVAEVSDSRNAIVVAGGVGSLILSNTVSASQPGLFRSAGAGILLVGSDQALVQGNQVSGADYGIVISGLPGDPAWALADDNIIADNQVTANAARGVVLQGNVQNNTLTSNLFSGSPMAVSLSVSGFGASPSANTFIGNQLTSSSQYGFRVRDELLNHPFVVSTLMANEFSDNGFHLFDFSGTLSAQTIAPDNLFDRAAYLLQADFAIWTVLQPLINASSATGIVIVHEGLFDEALLIDKPLTLRGRDGAFPTGASLAGLSPASHPGLTLTSGPVGQTIVSVASPDVTIEGLIFDVDQTFAGSAIRTQGDVDGLVVRNNEITTSLSDPITRTSFDLRNAVAINLNLDAGSFFEVVVENNLILGLPDQPTSPGDPYEPVFFRAGVDQNDGAISLLGNDIQAASHDAIIRFSSNAALDINGNTFRGGGLQVAEVNGNVPMVSISANQFQPDNAVFPFAGFEFGFGEFFQASLRLQNSQAVPHLVAQNSFIDHSSGISAEKMAQLVIDDNSFAPSLSTNLAAPGERLRHLIVNNKLLATTAGPAVPMAVTISGNDFDGGAAAAEVVAVEYRNHDAALAGNALGQFEISGMNDFSDDLDWFIVLDDQSFADSQATGIPGYAAPIASTSGAPFGTDVDARGNVFSGVAGADQTDAQRALTLNRIQDLASDPALGRVILEQPGLVLGTQVLNFGTLAAGDQATLALVYENIGDRLLEITDSGSPAPPFSVANDGCGGPAFQLAAGDSCTVDYAFAPTSVGSFEQNRLVQGTQPGGDLALDFLGQGVAGAADRIEAASPVSISGQAGNPVDAGDRPTVRVVDAFGNPVAGVTVGFEVTSGGGTGSGLVQVSDAAGLAMVGSWTLGPQSGNQQMTASAPGLTDSPITFTALTGSAADLAITIEDNRTAIGEGQTNTYVIVVSNLGPSDVVSAEVSVPLAAELESAGASWVCFPGANATCSASGSGQIVETVDLAGGSSVTFVLEADVNLGPTQTLEMTATVQPPVGVTDPNLDNNSDTDLTTIEPATDAIFADRFEDD